jgi:hypothetical protein
MQVAIVNVPPPPRSGADLSAGVIKQQAAENVLFKHYIPTARETQHFSSTWLRLFTEIIYACCVVRNE